MNLLDKIAQRHDYWITLVKSFGVNDYTEDIVQEMYLKAWRYIEAGTLREETVNTYIYTILRSLCVDLQREQKRKPKVSLNNISKDTEYLDLFHYEELDKEKEKAYNKISKLLYEEIETWHWFDKMLFKDIYIDKGLSMRAIQEETNISLATIFHTIKRCKQKCKENVKEDIEDFKHGEYERI